MGAAKLTKNLINHSRIKHIKVRYHFIRDDVGQGDVELTYVESKSNFANMFRKTLSKTKLSSLRRATLLILVITRISFLSSVR